MTDADSVDSRAPEGPPAEPAPHDPGRAASARSRATRWLVGAVVCGMLGRSEGLWESQRPPADRSHPDGATSDTHLSLALINTAFQQSIDSALARRGAPLHVTAWEWGPDGSLVLTVRRPNLTWLALSPEERSGLTALIAATYTAFLLRMHYPIDLAHRGQPVVALAYEGDDHALAIRTADGRVHVYRVADDTRQGVAHP